MKKLLSVFLVVLMCLSFCSCASKNSAYRGYAYGMSFGEVREIEEGFGSKLIEEDEDRMLYETVIEKQTVRIVFNFEDSKLTDFNVCANPNFGTDDYIKFAEDFSAYLDDSIEKDGASRWHSDYETVKLEKTNNTYIQSAVFSFELTK